MSASLIIGIVSVAAICYKTTLEIKKLNLEMQTLTEQKVREHLESQLKSKGISEKKARLIAEDFTREISKLSLLRNS
jgi:predicted anti-sigma-YlaC factor YlaD